MSNRKIIATIGLTAALSGIITAQKATLSEDDARLAIIQGTKEKGKNTGLVLRDSAQTWASLDKNSSTGFWVEAFTPTTWLMQQASNAAKKYQVLDPAAPVAPELLEPVLRVIAHPDMPKSVSANGMVGTASVEHIILRDESKKIVIQPTWTEAFDEEASNAMGGKANFKGLNAKFPIAALKEIRGAKGDAEFFITIVGSTSEEKNFKVKEKHFKELQ